jgi:N-acetylglucosaminyl-diphospho-decaprenol L-rhamnosyltransferase
MKVLIVIVSYRVTDLTIDCLRSLSGEIDRVPGTRVALCENGTGGDAASRLRRAIDKNGWGSWVDLTVIYPNRGFTGGNNAVIRPALESDDAPEYVWLLNADTIVLEHALETMVAFMDANPAAGIAATLEITPVRDGEKRSTPFRFPGILSELDRGLGLGIVSKLLSPWSVVVLPPPEKACRAQWVCLGSAMVRRTLLEDIGLLDEALFTYCDDIDLSRRAAQKGWETWFVPESRIIHFGGASTGIRLGYDAVKSRLPAYWYQARQRYFLKHHGPWYTAMLNAAFIVGFATWRLRRWIQRKPDNHPPHMLIDSIRHSVFCTGFKLKVVENPALSRQAAGA